MSHTDRRHFLTAAAGGLAAAPLATAVSMAKDKAPASGAKMRLGLCTYLWGRDWDLPTLVTNCKKAGVLAVETRTTHKHGVERSLTKAQRKDVVKRFADAGVTHLGPGSNERFDSPNPAKLKKSIEATKQFIMLSHDTGGTGVKVKPDSFHKGVPHEKTIEQIGKTLNLLGEYGAGYGQQIRLEVHGGCSHLPDIKAIMDVADHKNVAVCWNCNGQDLAGKGLEHNFNLVKDRFGATCHVRELDGKNYPYPELVKLLVKMDYAGWVLLECRGNPKDRVAAMIAQRELFAKYIAQAKA